MQAQGRRHRSVTTPSLAAAAVLCGMRGYKAMADWVQSLNPAAHERFGCRLDQGRRIVPSEYVIRDVLIRVDPTALDRALQRWNNTFGQRWENPIPYPPTLPQQKYCFGLQSLIRPAFVHEFCR
jgi:hypothetical protein